MADTPGVLVVKDGAGATKNLNTVDDGSGNKSTQHALRANNDLVSTANPLPVVFHAGVTMTQTVVALAADIDAVIIAANPNRRYLSLINLGDTMVTLGFGAVAVAGAGWPLPPAPPSEVIGVGKTWETNPPLGAIHGIGPGNTTVVVLEGV